MRNTLVGLMAILGLLATAGVQAQRQLVFYASLADAKGNPPASLDPASVRVLENGVEATVLKVEPINWPVRVEVLIDNGIAMTEALSHIRSGARGLLEALPQGIEITLLTTAPQPRTIVRRTADRFALLQGVDRIVPDEGLPRFIEALIEATRRIEKERNYFPVFIIVGSTAGEGSAIRERDIDRTVQQLVERAATVHVVMLSAPTRPDGDGGMNQTQVGIAAAKYTGGRYEPIAVTSRLATLLPEIGAQVAKSHARQSRQFRITVDRPNGNSGPLGEVAMAPPAGFTLTLSSDGRMP
jgi:hypothetical protein